MSVYFTDKAKLFEGSFKAINPGIKEIIVWLLWKYEQVFGRKIEKFKDVIQPKGLFLGSFDTELYLDYIKRIAQMLYKCYIFEISNTPRFAVSYKKEGNNCG